MASAGWDAEEELSERLAVIVVAAKHFVGVTEIEHLLVELLDFLEAGRVSRPVAVRHLNGLIGQWPGAPEALEFCMHTLRWAEVRTALEDHVSLGADSTTRDMALSVLESFEDDWPAAEIYRTYRKRSSQ